MGTRAQFFIGNPQDVEGRKWLGTVAWDGYPDGDIGDAFSLVDTETSFINAVKAIAASRDDFCDPSKRSFPFPWANDLFLTDCTYAWFDGAVQFTYFHSGFVPLTKYLAFTEQEQEVYGEGDKLPGDVVAPTGDGPKGPDSIMVFTAHGPASP